MMHARFFSLFCLFLASLYTHIPNAHAQDAGQEDKPENKQEDKPEDKPEDKQEDKPDTPVNHTPLSAQKQLRWGGDAEGGAPYIMQDLKDPSKTVGFEVDIADAIAKELGKTHLFVQNQWDGLIPGLSRDDYDIVLNGIEITDERREAVDFSIPYYVTFEQITVRKETYDINTLEDLKGKKVATLKAALSERILENLAPANSKDAVDIKTYDSQTTIYQDLENGRVDAVLLDHPIALYYGAPSKKLKQVGNPIGQLYYGIAVRKGDTETLNAINTSINTLIKNGTMRRIYENWGMWTPALADLFHDPNPSAGPAPQYEAFLKAMGAEKTWEDRLQQYMGYLPLLGKGAVTTLVLSVISMIFAIIIGMSMATIRLYGPKWASFLAVSYVEIIRGTPLLIQLYFIFYGLPNIGIQFAPFTAAVIGLAINYGANEAEVYRAGLQAIPPTQMEAALSLHMSKWQALRHIILPQAFRVVLPPITNDFISLLKDSSLVSVITMIELTKVYGQLASTYYDYFGIGLMTAIMYFLIGLPFVKLARWTEQRLLVYKK